MRMSDMFTMSLEATPDPADMAAVRDGLIAYNLAHAPPDDYRPLTLLVHDVAGALAGGLLGATYWGWLYVEILWMTESARRQGFGSRLLEQAEREALLRGCHAAHLDTMDFQALPFYKRRGYTIFGVLDDLPRGHKRYFLKKQLRSEALA
jgi:GNAT superfamily N-acetyltransferase